MLTFSLDGADIGAPIDTYNAAIDLGQSATVPTITVATSGMHTLRVRTTSTNEPRSTGFYGYLHWLRLVKQ